MIKKIFLILLSISIFIACKNDKNNSKNTANDSIISENEQGEIVEDKIYPQNLQDVSLSDLPKDIRIKGKIVEAKKWEDKQGENILIVSYLDKQAEKGGIEEDYNILSKEIFAKQYKKTDAGYQLIWDMYDFEKDCEFDITIELLTNSITITDLDKNGTTETTLLYKKTCRSDVSPADMRLIMYENNRKYALRGIMLVPPESDKIELDYYEFNLSKVNTRGKDDDYTIKFGRYENDKDFVNAPKEFLTFARKQWKNFVKEQFD